MKTYGNLIFMALLLCGLGVTSYTWFNQEQEQQYLIIDQDEQTFHLDLILYPGETYATALSLYNPSKETLVYRLYLNRTLGSIGDWLHFYLYENGELIFAATGNSFNRINPYYAKTGLKAKSSITYELRIVLDPDLPTEYNAESFYFDLVIEVMASEV